MMILSLAFAMLLSVHSHASHPYNSDDCAAFANAAMTGKPMAERVSLGTIAMNTAYNLGYDQKSLAEISTRIQKKIERSEMSLDGMERAVLLGCTNKMSADDAKPVRTLFDWLLSDQSGLN